MGKKITMNLGGTDVIVEAMTFETELEDYNIYKVEDGTTIKMKTVVTEIFRAEGKYTPDGDPLYHVKSANILVADVPTELNVPKTPKGDA